MPTTFIFTRQEGSTYITHKEKESESKHIIRDNGRRHFGEGLYYTAAF